MGVIKTHTFHGRRYKIDLEPFDGIMDAYELSENDRSLRILADLSTRKGLVTAIHEALHCENWAASEEVVDRVAQEIGSFLWRLGFRRKE